MLMDFNQYCFDTEDLLIFHDFSGRDTWLLADYFDSYCYNHLNRILYDITLRSQGSCSIDLENQIYFLSTNGNNGNITLVNPYKHSIHDLSVILMGGIEPKLRVQFTIPILKKIHVFKNHIYPLLRRFISHKNDLLKEDADIDWFLSRVKIEEFFVVDKVMKNNVGMYDQFIAYKESKEMKILDKIIDQLTEIVKTALIELLYIVDSSLDHVGAEIEKNIGVIHNDIYSWSDSVISHILTKFMNVGIDINIDFKITNYL